MQQCALDIGQNDLTDVKVEQSRATTVNCLYLLRVANFFFTANQHRF